MKLRQLIILISFFNSGFTCFAQEPGINGKIYIMDSSISYKEIHIKLLSKCNLVNETILDSNCKFHLDIPYSDSFELVIQSKNRALGHVDYFEFGSKGSGVYHFPMQCLSELSNPTCMESGEKHSDNIIRIFYGRMGDKEKGEIEKGSLYYGGCAEDKCNFHYYCKRHKAIFN